MRLIKINSLNTPKYKRNTKKIKYIVIHYTGMQSKRESIKRLTDVRHEVSCHYLIDRKGIIAQMIDDHKVAWHAGKSKWKGLENLNEHSIGIELVNKGHSINYENFPNSQIKSLTKVCVFLKKKYKIKKNCILGHSDIAPLRKKDPGEKFPWEKLSKKGIGIWYASSNKNYLVLKEKKLRNLFFNNLYKIGYRYFNKKKKSKTDRLVVKAFQRRFLQSKIDGKIDEKTFNISHFLANKA